MAKGDHKLLSEGVTAGLVRAITRNGSRGTCPCGFIMPVYPGRYPSKCPVCGRDRAASGSQESPEPMDNVPAVQEPPEDEDAGDDDDDDETDDE